jgi:hypothetical protein
VTNRLWILFLCVVFMGQVIRGHAVSMRTLEIVAAPADPLKIRVQALDTSRDVTAVTVYRIPQRAYFDYIRGARSFYEAIVDGTIVARRNAHIENGYETLELRDLPIGTYAIASKVYDPKTIQSFGATAITTLNVTTLGIVRLQVVPGPSELAYVAMDLTTHRRYPAPVRWSLADDDGEKALAANAPILRWAPLVTGQGAVIATGPDGSVAALQQFAVVDRSRDAGVISSDRPYYQGGDLVRLWGVVRSGTLSSYRTGFGHRTIGMRDEWYRIVASSDVVLSRDGTFATSIALPKDVPMGEYSLTSDGTALGNLRIATYRRPGGLITSFIGTSSSAVVAGSTLHLTFQAAIDGKPAPGATVRYRTWTLPRYDDHASWGPFASLAESPIYGLPSSSVTARFNSGGVVLTDSRGIGSFDVVVPSNGSHNVALNVLLDRGGAGYYAAVVPAARSVTIEPVRWFGYVGDVRAFHVTTADGVSGSPLGNVDVDGQIASRHWDGSMSSTQAQNFHVRTDSRGEGTLEWRPTDSGDAIVTASINDDAERRATTSTYVWTLRHDDDSGLPALKDATAFFVPRAARGGTLDMLLYSPISGDAIVALSANKIVRVDVAPIVHRAAIVSEPVPSSLDRVLVSVQLPTDSLQQHTVTIGPQLPKTRLDVSPASGLGFASKSSCATLRVASTSGSATSAGVWLFDQRLTQIDSIWQLPDPQAALYGHLAPVDVVSSWTADLEFRGPQGPLEPVPPPYMADRADYVDTDAIDASYLQAPIALPPNGATSVQFSPDRAVTWHVVAMAAGTAPDDVAAADTVVNQQHALALRDCNKRAPGATPSR